MSKAFGIVTALIAMSFLSACATSQSKTDAMAAKVSAQTWEVSEVPFIQAVKVKAPVKSEIVENKVRRDHKQN